MSIEIIVKGGAGNQLFQYAYARALSLALPQSIVLNIKNYKNNCYEGKGRTLFLNKINCKLPLIRSEKKLNIIIRFYRKFLKKYNIKFYKEKSFDGNNNENIRDGYWQSPLYFNPFFLKIRKEFNILEEKLTKNFILAESSITNQTVCLHIRRTDYLEKENKKIFGICSKSYYLSAIEFVQSELNCYDFLVFTDDISEARKILYKIPNVRYAYDYNLKLEEEFTLMRKCNHFIISNSTFSWWVAYLETNINFEKNCIAPFPWFEDRKQFCTSLYLPNWIRLSK